MAGPTSRQCILYSSTATPTTLTERQQLWLLFAYLFLPPTAAPQGARFEVTFMELDVVEDVHPTVVSQYPDWAPSGWGAQLFWERYAFWQEWDESGNVIGGEDWADATVRVAKHVAGAEPEEKREEVEAHFREALAKGLFMPGGRIWYGSGREKGNLLNCYVIPVGDSKEGWGKALYDTTVISCTGGGVGMNGSDVRPKGTAIMGHGGTATGPISVFRMVNNVGHEIKSGGTRRVALMQCLNHDHPDIVAFLCAKLDLTELNNANISTVFMHEDPKAFFEKVEADGWHELKFPNWEPSMENFECIPVKNEKGIDTGDRTFPRGFDKDHVKFEDGRCFIKAKWLWHKIIEHSLQNGEPGILNGWYANRDSNIGYATQLVSTNPCGEIWLSPYENCCLGALVLPRFVKGDQIDWDALKHAVRTSVRFLDDVLDVNHFPMEENRVASHKYRRIGLGIMGLAHMLHRLGHKYSGKAGHRVVESVMKFIRDESYLASVDLAKEKGAFPEFNRDGFLKTGTFASKLPKKIQKEIESHGIRNCAILTIAPTGTTGMVQGVSTGIEPVFCAAYERRRFVKDKKVVEVMVDPLFKEFVRDGRDPSVIEGAQDLTPRQHFEVQAICQKYVDNAVSKTVNIPQGMKVEDFDAVLREFIPQLKGITVYPVGSRGEEPLKPVKMKDALKAAKDQLEKDGEIGYTAEQAEDEMDQSCANGVCEVPQKKGE